MKGKKHKAKKENISISQVLGQVIKKGSKKNISYQDLVTRLGNHALGLIVILFALPSALPLSIIPGFSLLFDLPIIIVAIHLIIGKEVLWLPKYLANKQINTARLDQIIKKTVPYLSKTEHLLKPRLLFLTSVWMNRLHGLTLLLLSILLAIPIPFSNFFLAILIIFMGFGLAENDGLMIILAYLGTFVLLFIFTQLTQALLSLL